MDQRENGVKPGPRGEGFGPEDPDVGPGRLPVPQPNEAGGPPVPAAMCPGGTYDRTQDSHGALAPNRHSDVGLDCPQDIAPLSNGVGVNANSQTDILELGLGETSAVDPPDCPGWRVRPRRYGIPLLLFCLTCVSTFFVGVTEWWPPHYLGGLLRDADGAMDMRRMLIRNWQDGLLYMVAVLAILLCHEMGHFVLTWRHRIRATLPFFLPLPITPIGTLGAVIGMDGMKANRKQIFDIGIAGPLAGLFVAVPILWAGVHRLDLTQNPNGMYQLDMPLIIRWMAWLAHAPGLSAGATIWQGQLNPLLMAGWVGLLVTGLNMLPVSQLDGGHVIYSLFGPSSRWIARLFMLSVICYVVAYGKVELTLMIGLILLIGTDHPPTSDDSVRLGWSRTVLALLSLTIPVLCIPPRLMITP